MKQPRQQTKLFSKAYAKSTQDARISSRYELMAVNIHFQPNSFQLIHLKPRGKHFKMCYNFVRQTHSCPKII